ncbi:uncharacterized protein LOC144009009 isoform X4 [Festucalex cinctus]
MFPVLQLWDRREVNATVPIAAGKEQKMLDNGTFPSSSSTCYSASISSSTSSSNTLTNIATKASAVFLKVCISKTTGSKMADLLSFEALLPNIFSHQLQVVMEASSAALQMKLLQGESGLQIESCLSWQQVT